MSKIKTKLTKKQANKLIEWSIKELENHPYMRIGQIFAGALNESFPSVIAAKELRDEHGQLAGYEHDTWEVKDVGELISIVKEHYCDGN